MICKKCKAAIPDGSLFCNYCGKKQTSTVRKSRTHKRATGTGTITKDSRNKTRPYIVRAPSTATGQGRVYLGAYPDMKTAQAALEEYMRNGRPDLYNATLADIYRIWSGTHFNHVGDNGVKLYRSMWKRFEAIQNVKMSDIKTAHFQMVLDKTTSKSAASIIKVMVGMLCKCAIENDIIVKDYSMFLKIPKFEKNEKIIFTEEQISTLWQHTDDKRAQAILAMIYMGFRIGELLMITPADINFEEGYLITGEKTEAGKGRVIPFPPGIPDIKDFFKGWCKGVPEDSHIWEYTTNTFRDEIFYTCLHELGMIDATMGRNSRFKFNGPHLTPHSTRHTFGSLSAKSGMRPDALQKIIGHANYSVTADIYIHKDIEELKAAMTALKKPDDTSNNTTN